MLIPGLDLDSLFLSFSVTCQPPPNASDFSWVDNNNRTSFKLNETIDVYYKCPAGYKPTGNQSYTCSRTEKWVDREGMEIGSCVKGNVQLTF